MGLQLDLRIIQLARDPKEVGGDLVGSIEPGLGEIIEP